MSFPSWDVAFKYLVAPFLALHNPTELRLDKMSQHLRKVYKASYRKRKREEREEERQLADEPTAAPVDNAERNRRYRRRKRAAEGGGEHGDEFPEGSGAGPSVSNPGKRRRQGRVGDATEGSTASGSTSAERMRRLRERRRTGQTTFGRSEQGGATADVTFVAGGVRRGGRRGIADISVPNLASENPEQGIYPPMEADTISLHDPVVQIDEEEMPSNSAPSQSDSISDGASQEPGPRNASRPNYDRATLEFRKLFVENSFGAVCSVCDRLWFKNDLKPITEAGGNVLVQAGDFDSTEGFMVCQTCNSSLNRGKVPTLSKSNGFVYPPIPPGLPKLDMISKRLISPRFIFLVIRRLCHALGNYGIIGQVINVPVDVEEMVRVLPRDLDNDCAINVSFKKHTAHKSSHYSGWVCKGTVYAWLKYLVTTPLYKREGITFDEERLNAFGADPQEGPSRAEEAMPLDIIDDEAELLASMQQTAMWNEDMYLELCPTMNRMPSSILYDENAEELSNPDIYFGVPTTIKQGVQATVFNKASSEARRADRRGARPDHILAMAMKVLYCRMIEGLKCHFKSVGTDNVTRAQLSDPEFQRNMMEIGLAFFKGIPNSVQYWQGRKQDLFAMIRQLGKPTMFLTLSASETQWEELLKVLHKLSSDYDDLELADPLSELSAFQKAKLVVEDPVTCVAYIDKLVDVIMRILKSKRFSPFGKYYVVDYFKRIEFQQRGSAHAHIMLWCANDPREDVSEDMPATIEMINTLCSIDAFRWLGPLLCKKQEHAHTRTCYKHNDKRCRFNIPYWPMNEDRVLVPLPADDSRRSALKKRALEFREILETKTFETLEDFLADCECTEEYYLEVIRAWLQRPAFFFKRPMNQLYMNPFNVWIGGVLRSNSDLQFIMDEYSCASYLVDYVNKTNRGISAFHRELLELQEQYPDYDYQGLLKKLGVRVLNSVEMCSQEAAWILLRLPMSEASRKIEFVPTMWPNERTRCRKRHQQMDDEGLDDDSTDVWTRNIVQKYEDRDGLEDVCLADFVAWYAPMKSTKNSYKLRGTAKILRWRGYPMSEMVEYKREAVLLFLPFRNERVDLLDQNKFLQLYDSHETELIAKRKEYDCELNLEQTVEEYLRIIAQEGDGEQERAATEKHNEYVRSIDMQPNNDDIENLPTSALRAIVKQRSNVMPKADYCAWMRQANEKQRMLILHIIHRLTSFDPEIPAMQIFLTGPAGSGKTFTLRLMMETYNRYSQGHNSRNNAYIACASTGKAAVNIDGVTVHRAYRIAISRQSDSKLTPEWLQTYRNEFRNVKLHIVDEVSMLSAGNFRTMHIRLQDIHLDYLHPFADQDVTFTGDLHQLNPVNALPIYKAPRNSIGGSWLWDYIRLYELDQVMRQTDVVFSTILTAIGEGKKLTDEQKTLIESRFKSVEDCQREAPNAVWLFHQNVDVDRFNREALSGLEGLDCLADDMITGHSTSAQATSARTKLHKMSTAQTSGLPYMVRFCIGKPYMITTNIDGDDNLVNGAIGELKYVEMRENDAGEEVIYRLWLQFDTEKIGTIARSKAQAVVNARPHLLQQDWTPITKQHVNIALGGTIKCKRIQFPIASACSMTIHKSQGGTFSKVVYQYSRSQEQRLVYVALSRVTSLEGLYLTYADNPSLDPSKEKPVFHHAKANNSPAMRELRDEYKRLRNNRYRTIGDDFSEVLASSGPACTLMTINVQSLSAHHQDISIDSILTSVDYLALSETCLTTFKQQINNTSSLLQSSENHILVAESGKNAPSAVRFQCSNFFLTEQSIGGFHPSFHLVNQHQIDLHLSEEPTCSKQGELTRRCGEVSLRTKRRTDSA
ncbi:conserved hypothetical protein [Culex quinquefasciatus]|uniref:ATP-dependent DNA helicase n=1 Tax=Culex quinquefasciatus TaxID=7176 RepID=B0W7Q6_CULQU|nr:conserved hypothetical protein [Culex quinquefasciatus]|eukprot:XP_001844740.1 conserved hypothetical protein [Culex quinquefasciatus]